MSTVGQYQTPPPPPLPPPPFFSSSSNTASCNPGWPQTHYVTDTGPEPLIPLSHLPNAGATGVCFHGLFKTLFLKSLSFLPSLLPPLPFSSHSLKRTTALHLIWGKYTSTILSWVRMCHERMMDKWRPKMRKEVSQERKVHRKGKASFMGHTVGQPVHMMHWEGELLS